MPEKIKGIKLSFTAKELFPYATEIYTKKDIKKRTMKYKNLRWLSSRISEKNLACDIRNTSDGYIHVIRHNDKSQYYYRTLKELFFDIDNNFMPKKEN